jgi:pSer/pThr/pTyr-binding forkhead associated (FHA) protein
MYNGRIEGAFELLHKDVSIGRGPKNDIRLPDSAVSARHARLVQEDEVFLIDEQSTNGTRLNGKRIERHPLRHGDLMQIGRYQLKFERDFRSGGSVSANDSSQLSERKRLAGILKAIDRNGDISVITLDSSYVAIGPAEQRLAIITRQSLGFIIRPLVGGNRPVTVNGRPLIRPMVLSHRDAINAGEQRLRFYDESQEPLQ